MALTDEDRAWARELAASMPPFTEQQRDDLALLLRPYVLDARRPPRSRLPRRPLNGNGPTA